MTVVALDDGSQSALANLHQNGPIALVFLRHFGCAFCKYQVAQLKAAADLPIYFVCMESPEEAAQFKKSQNSPHRFISDPERNIYETFGVKRGTARQMINLRTIGRGIKATLAGSFQGKPTSDPMQLAAVVVLDDQGKIRWSHFAKDASDVVSEETIRSQLEVAGR